jgi:nucleoside phosphorylase
MTTDPLPTSMSFGVVTALPKEIAAMRTMLDDVEDYVSAAGRVYVVGTVPAKGAGVHRIAVVLGDQGNNAASYWATVLTEDFPEVHAVLMVGIAGAIPHPMKPERHVRLGDIVVSGEGGVVQYDFVKDHGQHLEPRFPPRPPDAKLLQAAQRLRAGELAGKSPWIPFIGRAAHLPEVMRPPLGDDRLAHSVERERWIDHPQDRRRAGEPNVFIGTIACANRLLKNPVLRDEIRDCYGVLAVEMEGSGVAEVTWQKTMGYLIVRGTCDYCDGNKGDAWQGHASVLAAAYTRALLEETPPVPPRQFARQVRLAAPTDGGLRRIAHGLLDSGAPPSLLALFPDAAPKARDALLGLEKSRRVLSSATSSHDDTKRTTAQELIAEGGRHLILAPPGSGKTFALWHGARDGLDAGTVFPLYLPMATFDSWSDAKSAIAESADGIDVMAVLRDGRVRIILDGWTEFRTAHPNEVATCIRALASSHVVANGRRGSVGPAGFEVWELQAFSPATVSAAVSAVYPAQPVPHGNLGELLRLPLALALHLLLGGNDRLPGQLLSSLHNHLSRDLPSSFTDVLSRAIADIELSGGVRSTARLLAEIRERGRTAGIPDPEQLLERLGTLDTRRAAVVPLHDLYWSWLAGRGILREAQVEEALSALSTRESIQLALESGEIARAPDAESAITDDIVLAEHLSRSIRREGKARDRVQDQIAAMMSDSRLAVKARGALAGIGSEREDLFRRALEIVTELRDAGVYLPALRDAILPERLFGHRGIVAEWYGAHGSDLIADALAERGGPEWSPWVHQLVNEGKMALPSAVGILLACEGRLTPWTSRHLGVLLDDGREMHRLRAVAKRGTNIDLARLLAEQFEKHLGKNDSRFLEVRDVFVGCGDDPVFERLLERFPTLPGHAQTLLGYTITARGEPWLGRFQKTAVEKCPHSDHHELLSQPSQDIDEATARRWIEAGFAHLGWRVLAVRNVPNIARELVDALPSSFDGLHDVAPLYAMRYLEKAPPDLVDEIWSRLSGNIQPKLMDQVLSALAAIRPVGVPSMAGRLAENPTFLPTFHLLRYLHHLQKWEAETSLQLRVSTEGRTMGLLEWLLADRLKSDREDTFLRLHLKAFSGRIMPVLLEWFDTGDEHAFSLIKTAGSVSVFHEGVVSRLLSTGEAALIAKLFTDCLDTFPEEVLMRLVEANPDDRELVRGIAERPSPAHARVHVALAKRVLNKPLDVWALRDLARIFSIHPKASRRELVDAASAQAPDRIWFIREIENATKQLLLTEVGAWRDAF